MVDSVAQRRNVFLSRIPLWSVEANNTSDSQDAGDLALLERVAKVEERVLAELYERHAQPLMSYLLELTGDHSEAEEIIQDTFVAVWRSAHAFQRRSLVRTWIFGISRRRARDRRRRKSLGLDSDTVVDQLADAGRSPEEHTLAKAGFAELISRLSPVHREVLSLAFVHDLPHDEIAKVLDVPVGTVKSRLSNAKRALERHLKEHGEDLK